MILDQYQREPDDDEDDEEWDPGVGSRMPCKTSRATVILQGAFIAVMLVGIASSGCVSSSQYAARRAREFVSAEAPRRRVAPKGSDERPNQATFDAMRLAAERNGGRLIAVAYLANSFHNYTVAAYLEGPDGMSVTATSMFWGDIEGKWRAPVERERLTALFAQVQSRIGCEEGRSESAGTVLVHWSGPQGRQVVCNAGLFNEESSWLIGVLEALTGAPRVQVYTAPEKAP